MFYITFISLLIDSLILNLRHLILTTFYTLSGVFIPSLTHPFKFTYKSRNKPYKGMYKSYNFDLASPSIDHSIKFSDSLRYAKRVSIEVLLNVCVSTLL